MITKRKRLEEEVGTAKKDIYESMEESNTGWGAKGIMGETTKIILMASLVQNLIISISMVR